MKKFNGTSGRFNSRKEYKRFYIAEMENMGFTLVSRTRQCKGYGTVYIFKMPKFLKRYEMAGDENRRKMYQIIGKYRISELRLDRVYADDFNGLLMFNSRKQIRDVVAFVRENFNCPYDE